MIQASVSRRSISDVTERPVMKRRTWATVPAPSEPIFQNVACLARPPGIEPGTLGLEGIESVMPRRSYFWRRSAPARPSFRPDSTDSACRSGNLDNRSPLPCPLPDRRSRQELRDPRPTNDWIAMTVMDWPLTAPRFSVRRTLGPAILGHLGRGSRSSIGEAEGQLLLAPLGVGHFEYQRAAKGLASHRPRPWQAMSRDSGDPGPDE
jgi:hypothetical protein